MIKNVTCDTWHVTPDTWHLTCDTWHVTHAMGPVTHGGGWIFSQNYNTLSYRKYIYLNYLITQLLLHRQIKWINLKTNEKKDNFFFEIKTINTSHPRGIVCICPTVGHSPLISDIWHLTPKYFCIRYKSVHYTALQCWLLSAVLCSPVFQQPFTKYLVRSIVSLYRWLLWK